jgi:hypothetical protein
MFLALCAPCAGGGVIGLTALAPPEAMVASGCPSTRHEGSVHERSRHCTRLGRLPPRSPREGGDLLKPSIREGGSGLQPGPSNRVSVRALCPNPSSEWDVAP